VPLYPFPSTLSPLCFKSGDAQDFTAAAFHADLQLLMRRPSAALSFSPFVFKFFFLFLFSPKKRALFGGYLKAIFNLVFIFRCSSSTTNPV